MRARRRVVSFWSRLAERAVVGGATGAGAGAAAAASDVTGIAISRFMAGLLQRGLLVVLPRWTRAGRTGRAGGTGSARCSWPGPPGLARQPNWPHSARSAP